jgi:hypothetical protein
MTTLRPSPHLNPFYIEESHDLEYSIDDDDYQLSDGDEDDEVEGLLGFPNSNHTSYDYPTNLKRAPIPRLRPSLSCSNILCFSIVFLAFMALLSVTRDNDDAGDHGNVVTPSSSSSGSSSHTHTPATQSPTANSPTQLYDATKVHSTTSSKKNKNKKKRKKQDSWPSPAISKDAEGTDNSSIESIPTLHMILLGERHSGVEWLRSELQACFQSATIDFGIDRPGYWFQSTSRIVPEESNNNTITIPILVVRQVSTWILAMQAEPWYAPFHAHLKWRDFVSMEWSMQRPEHDKSDSCQFGFLYPQVVPCTWLAPQDNRASHPVYEQHKNGSSFQSILELRAAKLRQFVKLKGENGIIVQFEETLQAVLEQIEQVTGVKHTCSDKETQQNLRDDSTIEIDENLSSSDDFIEYLTAHVDWKSEKLVGYPMDLP